MLSSSFGAFPEVFCPSPIGLLLPVGDRWQPNKNRDFRERGKTEKQVQIKSLRPIAFRPHLSMGLALAQTANDFVRLPQVAA
jgi:hypothetical protein